MNEVIMRLFEQVIVIAVTGIWFYWVFREIIVVNKQTCLRNSSKAISPWATAKTSLTIDSWLFRSISHRCPRVISVGALNQSHWFMTECYVHLMIVIMTLYVYKCERINII